MPFLVCPASQWRAAELTLGDERQLGHGCAGVACHHGGLHSAAPRYRSAWGAVSLRCTEHAPAKVCVQHSNTNTRV